MCLQGSIRENIACGCPEATDEQVVEAANAANAMAFIKKAPAGFRTMARAHSALTSLLPVTQAQCLN